MGRTGLRLCFAHTKFKMSENVHRMRSIITHVMAKALGDPIPISGLVDTRPNLHPYSSLCSSFWCDRSVHLWTHCMFRHYFKSYIKSAKMNSTTALGIYPKGCEGFFFFFPLVIIVLQCNVVIAEILST